MPTRAAVALTLLALAGCVQDQGQPIVVVAPEELPPGYPPKIGDVNATLDGKPVQWTTYDYSVGAFDAAVQIRGDKTKPEFHLVGAPPGKTDGGPNMLRIEGLVGTDLKAGVLTAPLVEIDIGDGQTAPRYTSFGQTAEVVLDEVVDTEGPMGYGHLKGHFSAHLCVGRGEVPVINPNRCRDIAGTFESEFQYDVYQHYAN